MRVQPNLIAICAGTCALVYFASAGAEAQVPSNPFTPAPGASAGPAAGVSPSPTLPKHSTVAAWTDSTTPLQKTGGLKPLYVKYDELRYSGAALGVKTETVAGPDFSKIFTANGLGGSAGSIPYDPADPAMLVRTEANAKTRGANEDACARHLPTGRADPTKTTAYQILSCRTDQFSDAVTSLGRVVKRDVAALNQYYDQELSIVAAFDKKIRTTPISIAPGDLPKTGAKGDDGLNMPPAQVRNADEIALITPPLTAAGMMAQQFAFLNRRSDYRSVLDDAPNECMLEQAIDQQQPTHVKDPFVELNDGCADLLSQDRTALQRRIRDDADLSAAQRTELLGRLPDLSAFQTVVGAKSGSIRDAYETALSRVQQWQYRFSNVAQMKFYLATDTTSCPKGFNGATHTVHITAKDEVPADNGGKNLDRDVVVVTCNSAYMKSVGLGYSALPTVSFNAVPNAAPTSSPAPGSFVTTNTLQQSRDTGRSVGALLAHRCLCPNPGEGMNTAFTFGVGASAKDAAELVAGFSVIADHKFFLTIGGHYGAVNVLAPGANSVGSLIPSDYKIVTNKEYQTRLAILLTLGL